MRSRWPSAPSATLVESGSCEQVEENVSVWESGQIACVVVVNEDESWQVGENGVSVEEAESEGALETAQAICGGKWSGADHGVRPLSLQTFRGARRAHRYREWPE